MVRLIGISGAHRSGKTTLAKTFTKDNPDWTFRPVMTHSLAGLNPVGINSIGDRLLVQCEILANYKKFIEGIQKEKIKAIVDRTPLDIVTYMMCEVTMNSDPQYDVAIQEFVDDAIGFLNRSFEEIFLIYPLSRFVEEEGKAGKNISYQNHYAYLLKGLSMDKKISTKIRSIPFTDMTTRLSQMKAGLSN